MVVVLRAGLFLDTQRNRKQITYHLPLSKWEETGFAETLEKAPEFDGHTPDDVLEIIYFITTNMTNQHTTSLEHSRKLADACQKMGVEMPESYFLVA